MTLTSVGVLANRGLCFMPQNVLLFSLNNWPKILDDGASRRSEKKKRYHNFCH